MTSSQQIEYISNILAQIEKTLHKCIQTQAELYFEVFVNRGAYFTPQTLQPTKKRKRDVMEGQNASQWKEQIKEQIKDEINAQIKDKLLDQIQNILQSYITKHGMNLLNLQMEEQKSSSEAIDSTNKDLSQGSGIGDEQRRHGPSDEMVKLADTTQEKDLQGLPSSFQVTNTLIQLIRDQVQNQFTEKGDDLKNEIRNQLDDKVGIEFRAYEKRTMKQIKDSIDQGMKEVSEVLSCELEEVNQRSQKILNQEKIVSDAVLQIEQIFQQLKGVQSKLQQVQKNAETNNEFLLKRSKSLESSLTEQKNSLQESINELKLNLEKNISDIKSEFFDTILKLQLNYNELKKSTTNVSSDVEKMIPTIKQISQEVLSTKEKHGESIQKLFTKLKTLEESKKDDTLSALQKTNIKIESLEMEVSNFKADSDTKIATHCEQLQDQYVEIKSLLSTEIDKALKRQKKLEESVSKLMEENLNLKQKVSMLESSQQQDIKLRSVNHDKDGDNSADPTKLEKENEIVVYDIPTEKMKTLSKRKIQKKSPEKVTIRNEKSKPPCVLFSGFKQSTEYDLNLLEKLSNIVQKLGGTIVSGFDSDVKPTHVVSPPHFRSLKTVIASVRNTYICKADWLLDSEKSGQFLDCSSKKYGSRFGRKLFEKKIGFSSAFLKEATKLHNANILIEAGDGEIVDDLSQCDFIICTKKEVDTLSKQYDAKVMTWTEWLEYLYPE